MIIFIINEFIACPAGYYRDDDTDICVECNVIIIKSLSLIGRMQNMYCTRDSRILYSMC
jgi:hypothetical protein